MKNINHRDSILLLFIFIWIIIPKIANTQNQYADSCTTINFGYNYFLPDWMVTQSVSNINTSYLDKSVSSNFGSKLHGRIAGLTVSQTSNEPGSESISLFSRGVGTFGSGRNVLILVDGFESFYDQLLPEEIEAITLLKDAAATTMYGMRGANGVLLITTKRGIESPLKVNFSSQIGFETPQRLPEFLNSFDYAQLYNEALKNDGLPLKYTENDLSAYKAGSDPYFHPDVNWHDELLRAVAPVSKYNMSFTGGQKDVRYFVVLGYQNHSGIYKQTYDKTEFSSNSNNSQFNIRSNIDIDLSSRLVASINLGFSLTNKENPGAYNTGTIFNKMSLIPPNAFPVFNPNGTYGGNSLYTNPWGDLLETGFYTSNYRTSQSAIKLTYQLDRITDGLSISAATSFNNRFRGFSSKSRSYDRYSITKDSAEVIGYRKFGEITSLVSSESQFEQWRNVGFQSSLNYNKEISENFIDAALGYDMSIYTLQGERTNYKHLGINGRFAYAYQMKYIGEISLGYYGSNGFRAGERFGLFPGASIGWIISKEDFMKSNTVVDFLKIKTSIGISGNNSLSNQRFMYDQYYSAQGSYIFGSTSVQGYAESTIANPNLTWEKKKEINFGVDATLIKLFTVNFDIFWQKRYDILASPDRMVPGFAGMLTPQLNVGKVDNKGFEAVIGYQSKSLGDVTLFGDMNIWYAKNEITFIPEALKQESYQLREGKRIDQPFLLQYIDFFRNESDVVNSPFQNFDVVQAGDIKYKDQNNDDIVDERDFYPIGYSNIPELTFGLNLGLRYKNFNLKTFFQGVTNRSVYLSGNDFYAFQNDGKISAIALNRWTDSTFGSANYPRLSSQNNSNNFQKSSFWQRNGSFIKFRNIELGYQLRSTFLNRIGIKEAMIFINGTNLFTLDYVKIADPEILSGYPAMRKFNLGVEIQF